MLPVKSTLGCKQGLCKYACAPVRQPLLKSSAHHLGPVPQHALCSQLLTHQRKHRKQHTHGNVQLHALGAAESSPAPQQAPDARFDLPLAIALAAVAFEAYLEPSGAEEQYQEVLLNDTHVTYTDRDFLLSTFDGLLQLTVHGAKGLKAVNITGGSDPYVIATLGDSSATTDTKWGDLNPTWDETHTLYVTDVEQDIVRLRVMDRNKLISDVDLGVVMVAISDLLESEGQPIEVPLRGANAQGSLTVSASFLPFSEALLDAAIASNLAIPAPPESLTDLEGQLEAALVIQETVAATVVEQTEEVKAALAPAAEAAATAAKQAQQQAAAAAKDLTPKAQAAAGVAAAALAPTAEAIAPVAESAAAALQGVAAVATAAAAAKVTTSSVAESRDGEAASVPVLGRVVEGAKEQAVQTLTGALDRLQGRLASTGMQQQAKAVAEAKGSVVGAVSEAAEGVKNFVQKEGLSELPVTDLSAIIRKITSSRTATDDPDTAAATAAAATAAAAAATTAAALPPLAPEAMPGAWKALASVAGKMVEDVFRPVAYIENKTTDTQVWVQVSRELREVVVAFRGTEQVKWKDFVSDINFIPQTLDVERTGGLDLGIGTIPLPFASFKKNTEMMVHSGFLTAYDSVKMKVLRLVDQLTADASPEQPWKVFVTGHSLGGALATLCAYNLAGRRDAAAAGRHIEMYTYGAPRVGNKAFADAFNERLRGNAWRITNTADIVPSVPRLMGYAHVRTGVRLDGSGRLSFEDSSKDVLGEGREVAEVVMELASQALEVAQGQRALEDVVDAIQEHEMNILNALVDGSALGQHMEDFYLATLKEAVLAADPALAGQVQQALEAAAAKVGPAAAESTAAAAS